MQSGSIIEVTIAQFLEQLQLFKSTVVNKRSNYIFISYVCKKSKTKISYAKVKNWSVVSNQDELND